MRIGYTASDPVGFHNKAATVQRKASAQAAVSTTVGSAVAATVGGALATTAATTSTPYGFSQAQADGLIARVNALIVDNAALVAQINLLRTDSIAKDTLVNELRTALVNKGFIKGAA
jgi:hypothetical protein